MAFARAFLQGASYPIQAVGLLASKLSLLKYVIIPILVNIFVGAALYAGLLAAGMNTIDQLTAGMPGWAAILAIVLKAVLVVILFVAIGFVLLRFGVVLGAPWYGQLAESIERLTIGGQVSPPLTLAAIARDLWQALMFELKKLLLLIGCGIPILLLNFIPVAGSLLVVIASTMLSAIIVCLDFFEPSLSRRYLAFRKKLDLIRRTFPASAGFGLFGLLLVAIPFLNLLAIPVCVAGGTLFFCEHLWRQLSEEEAKKGKVGEERGGAR